MPRIPLTWLAEHVDVPAGTTAAQLAADLVRVGLEEEAIHPAAVTGPLVVKLWASSDSPDTDFTAKLVDVYPPSHDFPSGYDLNIGDGIVRARYRHSMARAEFLKPGQPYEFTIEMYPTALVFAKGHRIRLDISSSNFPRFDVNPNTGEPLNANRRWHIAENTIYLDPAHPSHITLPVIPNE